MHCAKLASTQQPNAPVATMLTVFYFCSTWQATPAFPLVPLDPTWTKPANNVYFVVKDVDNATVRALTNVPNVLKTARMWHFIKTRFTISVLKTVMQVSMNTWALMNVSIVTKAVGLAWQVQLTAILAKMNLEFLISCIRQTDKINAWWTVQQSIMVTKLQIYVLIVTQDVLCVLGLEMDHAPFVRRVVEWTTFWFSGQQFALMYAQVVSLLIRQL